MKSIPKSDEWREAVRRYYAVRRDDNVLLENNVVIYGGLCPTRRGIRLIKTAIKSLEKRGLTDPFWKPIAERLGLSRNLEMMKIMGK